MQKVMMRTAILLMLSMGSFSTKEVLAESCSSCQNFQRFFYCSPSQWWGYLDTDCFKSAGECTEKYNPSCYDMACPTGDCPWGV